LFKNITRELNVVCIEFFLFAGQRYFFSLKKTYTFFNLCKKDKKRGF
jgi:hypothetical protein